MRQPAIPARIIFMGSPAFAVPSLTMLAERPDLCEVAAVVTQPDKPAGRGRKVTPSPVKVAAQARGIPVHAFRKMRAPETREALASHEPDLIVVAAYGRILPPALLELPRLGCVNVHASLLPRHRGASPVAHAIAAGDKETGVCIMQMDEGLDTGPVFSRVAIPIRPEHTQGSLTVVLAEAGAKLLVETLPGILDRSHEPVPQAEAGATYAPLLQKRDGLLDFALPAEEVERRVRALNPWPGAYAYKGEQRVQVVSAEVVDAQPGRVGEVLAVTAKGIDVGCGRGCLRLLRIRPAGRKEMDAGAWVAGRGIAVGDHLTQEPS